jgi:hypothetical protein
MHAFAGAARQPFGRPVEMARACNNMLEGCEDRKREEKSKGVSKRWEKSRRKTCLRRGACAGEPVLR